MKTLKYIYLFIWIFIINLIMGIAIGDFFNKIYILYDNNLFVGFILCVFCSLIVTWLPMYFLIENHGDTIKSNLMGITILLFIISFIAPLIFSFDALAILLLISNLTTLVIVSVEIQEMSNYLEDFRQRLRSYEN